MSKVAVLLAEGFETIEALTVVDVLRRAKVECDLVSMNNLVVTTSHNVEVKADNIFSETMINDYDMIVLPGGLPGSTNLRDDSRVINVVQSFAQNKFVASICAAPITLGKAGVLVGKNATCYPGFEDQLTGCNFKEDNIVRDGNILTARGPAITLPFSYEILKMLGYEKEAQDVSKAMLFDRL